MLRTILIQEAIFFVLACACLTWAQWRLPSPVARFPGPRPVAPLFKAWLVVIWLVGLALPLWALAVDGVFGGASGTRLALLPYLWAIGAQVVSELVCWKRLGSPVWVIVPCLYLPWRIWQCFRGLELAVDPPALTLFTLQALLVLWIVNVGVHYSNVPASLRWDYHARDARFPALRDPRVFVGETQDPRDLGSHDSREPGA